MQATEARAAAVEEVERLLQHSEDLKRLPTLCQDYEHKAQVSNTGRFGAAMGKSVVEDFDHFKTLLR